MATELTAVRRGKRFFTTVGRATWNRGPWHLRISAFGRAVAAVSNIVLATIGLYVVELAGMAIGG